METYVIDQDIPVFYVPAATFPEGIKSAHEQLHTLFPPAAERNFYGISRPENGVIAYKAAAEELHPGEAEELGCERMHVKKGNYISILVNDFHRDLQGIDRAFKMLLEQPGLDPKGYCVEWYVTQTNVRCMIRLQDV
jgi:hypothetical protein